MVREARQCNQRCGRVQGIISTTRQSSDHVIDAMDTQTMVPHSSAESFDHIPSATRLD
jgi:hypothetical protein